MFNNTNTNNITTNIWEIYHNFFTYKKNISCPSVGTKHILLMQHNLKEYMDIYNLKKNMGVDNLKEYMGILPKENTIKKKTDLPSMGTN